MAALDRVTTMLFVPGSRPDRFAKAAASGADLVVIDFEDAVAPADKPSARQSVAHYLRTGTRAAVRINQLTTTNGLADLLALAPDPPVALFLPKIEQPGLLAVAAGVLPGVPLVPLVETPEGLAHAPEIARAPQVAGIMLGGADLCAELGVDIGWDALAYARGALVLAAARAGIPAIDVPWIALDDPAGLDAEAVRVKAMGFAAKAAIHPAQIAAIARAFRPSAAEVDEARAALDAFQAQPGAAQFNGRLLEAPVVRRYRRVLAAAGEESHA